MDQIELHVPTTQYGFITVRRDFALENKDKIYREAVADFRRLLKLWKEPNNKPQKPTYLGQQMVENGHLYEAMQNEKTKEFYWMIKEV